MCFMLLLNHNSWALLRVIFGNGTDDVMVANEDEDNLPVWSLLWFLVPFAILMMMSRVCKDVCMPVQKCAHIYIYTYLYICTYIHVWLFMYIRIHILYTISNDPCATSAIFNSSRGVVEFIDLVNGIASWSIFSFSSSDSDEPRSFYSSSSESR